MKSFLNREQNVFRRIAGIFIYYTMFFLTFNSIDVGATELSNISIDQSQLDSHPASTPFRTAQVFLDMFEKKTSLNEETVKLSEKEKKIVVEQGVIQYQKGEREKAKKTFEYAKMVFPSNYAVPYYLGLIYLEEGRRSEAIAEWQQFVLMDPKSEDSLKIQKYLTLLIREEAVENAKQAVANEDTLIRSPVDDNTVAVNTFKNLGSENLEPLGKGMAAMLIHDLSQVPGLQVVERVKIVALLQEMNLGNSGLFEQKTAHKVGKLLKSKHFAVGSLTDLEEENLQIASVLIDTEQMDSIINQEAQGAMKRFYDLEKDIACKIIKDLGYDCDKMPGAFGKIHTQSLGALTSYSVGLNYLDKERYDEARKEFQKAIDEDPEFDLAKEALLLTPTSAMFLKTPAQMILALSSSGGSSTAFGSASTGDRVADDDDGMGVVGVTTTVIIGAAVIAGTAAAIGSGGGDDSSGPSPALQSSELNLTGDWSGTWSDSSGTDSGNISLSLTQTNTSVTGSVSITGSKCISTGTLSGTITGNALESVIQTATDTASFNANCTSTSMNGTLEVTSGPCSGETGTFSTSKTGSINIKW